MSFKIFFVGLLLFNSFVFSQTIKSVVIDSETNENVPYALITIGPSNGVTADGDGFFEIEIPTNKKQNDSLKVSSIGYKDVKIPLSDTLIRQINLQRDIITMNEVVVTSSNYTLEEIIEKVKANTLKNYNFSPSKKTLFFRQEDKNKINKLGIEFKKSTIPEINQNFVNNELNQIPRTSSFYTEVLADWYTIDDNFKMDIAKAVKFYDTYSNSYLDVFNTKLEDILNRNFKKDSYFKIKSGIFSIKTDGKELFSGDGELLDMRNEMNKKEEVNKNFFYTNTKNVIDKVFSEVFFGDDSSLNFIKKSSRYNFELVDTVEFNDDLVYKINFFPNGGEDFKGTFYVNISDFALVKLEYQNIEKLRSFKLLGLSYQELGRKGIMVFEKGDQSKYELRFIEQIQEDKYGIDRPLKIIEKNKNVKGRRKQNEIASEVDFISTVVRKFQIYIYDNQKITVNEFDNKKENKQEQPKNWIKFYPNFWKGIPEGMEFKSNIENIKRL